MGSKLLTLQEVANYLDVPEATLYAWRQKRTGPQGIRVGRHVRYREADVERWLDEQVRREGATDAVA
jgi:excisionase family DNA binding protein